MNADVGLNKRKEINCVKCFVCYRNYKLLLTHRNVNNISVFQINEMFNIQSNLTEKSAVEGIT